MDKYENRRLRLRALVDQQFDGVAANLARAIERDPSYIARMLSDPSKPGHKRMMEGMIDLISKAARLPAGWFDVPVGENEIQERKMPYAVGRVIPVLSTVQAGEPRAVIDDYAPGAGWKEIQLDPMLADACSQYTFALEVSGNSMQNPNKAESLNPGDIVVVDPGKMVGPGDIVVAKLDHEGEATIKKYRDRGADEQGRPQFQLVPLNDSYPPINVDTRTPGRVIGPVIEVRRKLHVSETAAQAARAAPQKADPELVQWAIMRVTGILAKNGVKVGAEQLARICAKVYEIERTTGSRPNDAAILSIAESMA